MNAPACPISRNQALPGMPGRMLPPTPRALDLPSLIAATNALRDLVLAMIGSGVPANNLPPMLGPNLRSNGSMTQDPGAMVVVRNDWIERYRDEERLTVMHPVGTTAEGEKVYDRTKYVDVVRINKLVFHWEHNDISMPEDAFEWAYDKSDYATDVWLLAAQGVAFGWGQGPY